MKKHHILSLLMIVILLFVNAGCSKAEEATTDVQDDQIKIGFSMATLLEDRWLRDRDIFLAKAQEKNMEVIIRNANMNSNTQYEQVVDLLNQDIDVLVIAPNDVTVEKQCVDVAKSQGIPVIMYDRLIYNTNADVYIAFDGIMVGNLMAEYLLSKAPEGGYLLVNGPKTDNNCLMIREGYMEILQPYIDSGQIHIVDETWTEGWVRENAYNTVIRNAASYPDDLVAAICENDSLAWGVGDALSEMRKQNILIVGMDADLSACQRIIAHRQDMTVYKPIQDLVEQTLNACETLVAGQELETTETIFDGTNDIPYIAIEVYAVTIDTMEDTVIADGFHLRNDIYSE